MIGPLLTSALIAALPGTHVVFGALPAGAGFPAIVLNIVAETAQHSHSGESDLHNYLVQLDCYAGTYAGAEDLYRQAHQVMQPPLAFLEVARRSRETGANEAERPFRVSADYRIFHAID